jgi:hypothetical protein
LAAPGNAAPPHPAGATVTLAWLAVGATILAGAGTLTPKLRHRNATKTQTPTATTPNNQPT